MRPLRFARILPVVALAVLVTACGKDKATDPVVAAMPDFELTDLNPNSATAGLQVSPRDYLQKVSVWYFGHST